jgi:hypothetical protein
MTTLISIQKAKEEIERLQQYIRAVESYEADTLDKTIIKGYALTNSINKTIELVNAAGYAKDKKEIDHAYVVSIIRKRGKDELHKLVRSGYMRKTRHSRG